MPQLLIRRLEPHIIQALKARALRNRRSLEGELRHILMDIVDQEKLVQRVGVLERAVDDRVERSHYQQEKHSPHFLPRKPKPIVIPLFESPKVPSELETEYGKETINGLAYLYYQRFNSLITLEYLKAILSIPFKTNQERIECMANIFALTDWVLDREFPGLLLPTP